MGKTPKKAAPGGDERNLHNRRRKATTAPPNPSETSLRKKQRKSTISNRSKLGTLKKRVPRGPRTNFNVKLSVATKFELNRPIKPIDKAPESSKEKKLTVPDKSEESTSTTMQPELEEAETNSNTTEQVDYTKKDISEDMQESDKEHVDHTSSEPVLSSKTQENSADKEIVVEKEQIEYQEKTSHSDMNREVEEHEENELNLRFESEDGSLKIHEEKADDADSKEDNIEKCPAIVTNDVNEKEDFQCESQTDTETNSADILEFTTSEMSELSEIASQNDIQNEKGKEKEKEVEKEKEKEKEKEIEKSEDSVSKDVSFVSYNPSIMLKDVQIKLNDCLKENSKLFNTSNASQSTSSQSVKDMSFGKTLRSISGRRSLSRMRHVTLRERRYSPSDSMLVNVSSVSFSSDDTPDFKILRYSTELSDTVSTTNGSANERKRKHEIEDWNSTKKQKAESENSLLNSPVSLLKGLRKPIRVSTPVSELKFQSGKLELGENSKPANENSKKWCVIM